MNFTTTTGYTATNAIVAREITGYQVDSNLLVTVRRGRCGDPACSAESIAKARALGLATRSRRRR
jgi:hypothetical protein